MFTGGCGVIKIKFKEKSIVTIIINNTIVYIKYNDYCFIYIFLNLFNHNYINSSIQFQILRKEIIYYYICSLNHL